MPASLAGGAQGFVPDSPSLRELKTAVQGCRGCDLYRHATQAVFGEGSRSARIVFVGEQPGHEEDLQGHPFVGPAGKLLHRALNDAGIDPADIYVTNAVKHFKFDQRGKRRIHKKPRVSEVKACNPWLEAEMEAIKPRIIVCLGATAAQAILGSAYRVTKERGNFVAHSWGPHVTATIHPSAVLRIPDPEERHAAYDAFVDDLRQIAAHAKL